MISSWLECAIEGDLDGLKALYTDEDFKKYQVDILLYSVHFNYPDVFKWVLENTAENTFKKDVLKYIIRDVMKPNEYSNIIESLYRYKTRFINFDEIMNRRVHS